MQRCRYLCRDRKPSRSRSLAERVSSISWVQEIGNKWYYLVDGKSGKRMAQNLPERQISVLSALPTRSS
jgi:hypothetical protein